MKKLLSLSIMLLLLVGNTAFADTFGHEGATVENPTIEEMLVFALEDEIWAYSTYQEIIEAFDVSRPFSNIMKAELNHQESIKTLMTTYGYTIPQVDPSDHITLPGSLDEAYQAGVQAEIDNIALYEAFIKTDIPEDVKVVFESLIRGSENHKAAFEKQLDRNTSTGNNSTNNSANAFRRGRN